MRSGLLVPERIANAAVGLRTIRSIMPVEGFIRLDKGRIHRLTVFSAACEGLCDRPRHRRQQKALECGFDARGKTSNCLHHRAEPARED
jgi:hypothetical protein